MAVMRAVPALLLAVGAHAAKDRSKRLRIINGCKTEPLWVAHMASADNGPDPQNVRLEPEASYDFLTPRGLSGTRYWPKLGCDASGNNCRIGESGGPSEVCDAKVGCGPPVDTKFEASFSAGEGLDWVDISLVDGFTLPFKFELTGDCTSGFGNKSEGFLMDASWETLCDDSTGKHFFRNPYTGQTTWSPPKVIDCTWLSFDLCPTAENVGASGNVDLRVMKPGSGEIVGCYSPCSKLMMSNWDNPAAKSGLAAGDPKIAPYCCPTPPEDPQACRAGPVKGTQFVQAVHEMCPGVYGYSYDDGMGLLKCPSDTFYEVTFYCPAMKDSARPPPGQKIPSSVCTTTTVTFTTTTLTTTTMTWTTTMWVPPPSPAPTSGPVAAEGTTAVTYPAPAPPVTTQGPIFVTAPAPAPVRPAPFFIRAIRHMLHVIGLSEAQGGSSQTPGRSPVAIVAAGAAVALTAVVTLFAVARRGWRTPRVGAPGAYQELHRSAFEAELAPARPPRLWETP